jgi:hypothetical protein
VQELHRLLSDTSVQLHGEGKKGVAVRLHSHTCGPLVVILLGRGRYSRCGGGREGVDGKGVDDGLVGDADALGHGQEDVVAQHSLCSQGGAPHAVVGVRVAGGGPVAALHVRSIGGKHGEACGTPCF